MEQAVGQGEQELAGCRAWLTIWPRWLTHQQAVGSIWPRGVAGRWGANVRSHPCSHLFVRDEIPVQ